MDLSRSGRLAVRRFSPCPASLPITGTKVVFSPKCCSHKNRIFQKKHDFFSSNFRKTGANFSIYPDFSCCYFDNSRFSNTFFQFYPFLKIFAAKTISTKNSSVFLFFRQRPCDNFRASRDSQKRKRAAPADATPHLRKNKDSAIHRAPCNPPSIKVCYFFHTFLPQFADFS